ncbi:MAG: RDD family protein, partial [Bdellovibrionales bacterium]|nr:RDD family protein [Bdellovibrionales bacterium]
IGMKPVLFFIALSILSVMAPLLYGALFESSFLAATPGKIVMGLKVSTTDGQRLLLSDAFARNFFKNLMPIASVVITAIVTPLSMSSPLLGGIVSMVSLIGFLILLLYALIDPLMALFTAKKQALHDKWSVTVVKKVPDVNHWLRIPVSLVLAIVIFVLQGFTAVLMPMSQFQQLGEKLAKLEMEQDISFEDDDEELPPSPTNNESQTLSVSERIATELAKAREKARKLTEQESEARSEKEATESSSPTPEQENNIPKDFTPNVDGAEVLSRNKQRALGIPKEIIPTSNSFSGAVKVGKKLFQIKDVVGTISSNKRVIVINLYDEPQSDSRKSALSQSAKAASEDSNAVIRFKLVFSKFGNSCEAGQLLKYFVEVNTKKAGIRHNESFFSFDRGGNQIIATEFVTFKCFRKSSGFVQGELRGSAAFLIGGVRIPIQWNTEMVVTFP